MNYLRKQTGLNAFRFAWFEKDLNKISATQGCGWKTEKKINNI